MHVNTKMGKSSAVTKGKASSWTEAFFVGLLTFKKKGHEQRNNCVVAVIETNNFRIFMKSINSEVLKYKQSNNGDKAKNLESWEMSQSQMF